MPGLVRGVQGNVYPNRTDLQNAPVRTPAAPGRAPDPARKPTPSRAPAPGGAPAAAPRLPANPLGLAPPAPPAPAAPAPRRQDFTMESVPNATAPSNRPGESVLTGVEPFRPDGPTDVLAARLRALYLADPDPVLGDILLGLDRMTASPTNDPVSDVGSYAPGGNRFYGMG